MREAVASTLVGLLILLSGFALQRSDSLLLQTVGEVLRYGGAIAFAVS